MDVGNYVMNTAWQSVIVKVWLSWIGILISEMLKCKN